jgi:hypothetical protein
VNMPRIPTDPGRDVVGARSVVGLFLRLLFAAVVVTCVVAGLSLVRAQAAEAHPSPSHAIDHASVHGAPNGKLPPASLKPVAGVRLAADAADSFASMAEAARRDGVTIAVTDGYRSYDSQVDVKRRKGWLAATPGTSMHGWGIAVDFDTRVTDFGWLREHAGAFGWVHPPWAQPGGSKPEPWHWEYVGVNSAAPDVTASESSIEAAISGPGGRVPRVAPAVPAFVFAVGDLVATVRLEPLDGPMSPWFAVHEGLDELEQGARHYPGTAAPGEAGNFAIAGFQRDHAAPLRSLGRLRIGDVIAVRTPEDDEHRYVIVDRDVLTFEDGWAVGPDPLLSGSPRMMTVTTSAPDGRVTVVWARAL